MIVTAQAEMLAERPEARAALDRLSARSAVAVEIAAVDERRGRSLLKGGRAGDACDLMAQTARAARSARSAVEPGASVRRAVGRHRVGACRGARPRRQLAAAGRELPVSGRLRGAA